MWNLVDQDVVASLIYFFFIYTFFFINVKVLYVNAMERNALALDEELNLLWYGFLGMLFYMLLAFHINLIDTTCSISINFFITKMH